MPRKPVPLLTYSFRPFFLLAAVQAIVAMLLWTLALHGRVWPGAPALSPAWHAHEMLVGFAGAVVAGFVLTAAASWTGRPPTGGGRLAALIGAWLLGRLAMLFGGSLPAPLVLVADALFPLLLAWLVTREIHAAGNRRNYVVCALLGLFAILNLSYHLATTGLLPGSDYLAVLLLTHLLLALITLIGGRIIPAFTGNWLRRYRPEAALPMNRPWVERTVLPLTAAVGLADTLAGGSSLAGILALLAAVVHALRLAGWRGRATGAEPLLLVLHVGYAGLVAGYLLLGLSALGLPLPRSAALHLLTVGVIGGMIIAMITRVSLGHTGRPLTAGPSTVLVYLLLGLAVLLRVASPLSGGLQAMFMDLSSLLWAAAFALFLGAYARILVGPRPDA